MALRRLESAAETLEETPLGHERAGLPRGAGRALESRLVLGLRLQPHSCGQSALVALDRGQIHAGVPGLEGRSGHHGRGRDRHAGRAVLDARRAAGQSGRSTEAEHGLEGRLQPTPAAQFAGVLDPGRVRGPLCCFRYELAFAYGSGTLSTPAAQRSFPNHYLSYRVVQEFDAGQCCIAI